jgi:hypothetical protein
MGTARSTHEGNLNAYSIFVRNGEEKRRVARFTRCERIILKWIWRGLELH